jgi:hypothetical protein
MVMENNTSLTLPRIEGYTEEQIAFTMDEIIGRTDRITLQILLFKKFRLYDFQANPLIEKVAAHVGELPPLPEPERDMFQKTNSNARFEGAMDNNRQEAPAQEERSSGGNSFNVILGFIILGVGLAITLSGSGVIAYGAIIVGFAKIIGGLSNND